MSQSNFLRMFQLETGFSPQHSAMELRLEKARCRLATVKDSIRAIASDCGFSNRYAFSRAFRKYAGISPARYRFSTAEKLPNSLPGKSVPQ